MATPDLRRVPAGIANLSPMRATRTYQSGRSRAKLTVGPYSLILFHGEHFYKCEVVVRHCIRHLAT